MALRRWRSEEHTSELQSRVDISYAVFFFNDTATTEIYTLSLHDALPIYVILNIYFPAGIAQKPHERVSENGIAEVADVRGFVGIDAGVLDENFSWRDV